MVQLAQQCCFSYRLLPPLIIIGQESLNRIRLASRLTLRPVNAGKTALGYFGPDPEPMLASFDCGADQWIGAGAAAQHRTKEITHSTFGLFHFFVFETINN